MNEHEIEQFAPGLGDEAARRLHVEAVVSGVLQRLRAGETLKRRGMLRGRGRTLLQIAAAVVVLVGGGVIARSALEHGAGSTPSAMPAPVLAGLSADGLEEMFDSLAVEAPVHEFAVGGLQSLDETQLKELLQQMEG